MSCLLGPHFPETFVYDILYGCTAGHLLPEPVHALTGCGVVFPGQIVCDFDDNFIVCIMGPHYPEAFPYYIAWDCYADDREQEPVQRFAGCTWSWYPWHMTC